MLVAAAAKSVGMVAASCETFREAKTLYIVDDGSTIYVYDILEF